MRKQSLKKLEIYQCFEELPVLSIQSGKFLYLEDFDKLYPKHTNMLYSKWNNLKAKIIGLCLSKSLIPEDLTSHNQGELIYYCLLKLYQICLILLHIMKHNFFRCFSCNVFAIVI